MRTDTTLTSAARRGDQHSFVQLYQRYHRRALSEARRVLHNRADAEDAVARAFASTFLAIRDGKGPDDTFRAYLLVAVRHSALQMVRKISYSTEVPTDEPADSVGSTTPHHDAYRVGDDAAVRLAFEGLPSRWQQVLWRTEIEGVPPRELAFELEMSPNSVAALAKRAREGLRRAYLQHAVGDDPHAWVATNLAAYLAGELDPDDRDLVGLHVESCPACEAAVPLGPAPVAVYGLLLLLAGVPRPSVSHAASVGAGSGPARRVLGRACRRARRLAWRSSHVAVACIALAAVAAVVVAVAAAHGERERGTADPVIVAPESAFPSTPSATAPEGSSARPTSTSTSSSTTSSATIAATDGVTGTSGGAATTATSVASWGPVLPPATPQPTSGATDVVSTAVRPVPPRTDPSGPVLPSSMPSSGTTSTSVVAPSTTATTSTTTATTLTTTATTLTTTLAVAPTSVNWFDASASILPSIDGGPRILSVSSADGSMGLPVGTPIVVFSTVAAGAQGWVWFEEPPPELSCPDLPRSGAPELVDGTTEHHHCTVVSQIAADTAVVVLMQASPPVGGAVTGSVTAALWVGAPTGVVDTDVTDNYAMD